MDKFVQLTCSASDFDHTLSSQIQFILHHKNIMCPLCPKQKRHTVKVYSFHENLGMADIVDSLLNAFYIIDPMDRSRVQYGSIERAWFFKITNGSKPQAACVYVPTLPFQYIV